MPPDDVGRPAGALHPRRALLCAVCGAKPVSLGQLPMYPTYEEGMMANPTPANNPGGLLDFFFQYVADLHLEWYTFNQLYGHSPERVQQLNRRTGAIFGLLERVLLDHLQLGIAKLFDRKEISGKPTASFARAIHELDLKQDDPRRDKLAAGYAALKTRCKTFIQQRHRRIAHNDRSVAVDAEKLRGPSRDLIRQAIDGVGALVNDMWLIHRNGEVAWEVTQNATGVDVLLRVLDAGNDVLDEQRRQRYGPKP
jgi:hypothetical protein